MDGLGTPATGLVHAPVFRPDAARVRPAQRRFGSEWMPHVLPHVLMVGVMAVAMLGQHSALRMLGGGAALLALATILAPAARRDPLVGGHIIDCFAMGVVLVAAITAPGHVDATAPLHAHASAAPLPPGALIALAATGWAGARLVQLLAAHTRRRRSAVGRGARRMSIAGAALTALGFVLMAAMG